MYDIFCIKQANSNSLQQAICFLNDNCTDFKTPFIDIDFDGSIRLLFTNRNKTLSLTFINDEIEISNSDGEYSKESTILYEQKQLIGKLLNELY